MHALLVSGSIGMGHDVMAEACADALVGRGWTTNIVDSIKLLGDKSGGMGERVFRAMLAVPGVYDAFHFEQLRAGGRLAVLAERASSKYLVPALDAELQRRPTDLLVAVFATAAGAASRLKTRYPGMRTAVFCTDVCPHRIWVHESTDLYLVTSEAARGFVRRFHPRAEVAVVPAPARAGFYTAPSQAAARAELGIPADARCVLLMAGSWGIGPLREIAARLGAAGIHTIAVAGRNAQLETALRTAAQRDSHVVPFGFTDRIPTLMSAADLVITTSGDTCTEARVIGRQLLLLDVVPGHGRENLQEELDRGAADVAPSDPDGLLRATLACLDRIPAVPQHVVGTPDAWYEEFGKALARIGLADVETSN
jgi:UDP-N-acetylglucosamine:LPS N-acetylglucosamine transferase